RLHGELVTLAHPPLGATDTKNLCYSLLTEQQNKKFEEASELDFSFGIKGVSRFRGNLYLQKGAIGGAFRMIPYQTPQLQNRGSPRPAISSSRRCTRTPPCRRSTASSTSSRRTSSHRCAPSSHSASRASSRSSSFPARTGAGACSRPRS